MQNEERNKDKKLSGILRHLIFGHFCARAIRKSLHKSLLEAPINLDRRERVAVMKSISQKSHEIMASDRTRIIDPPSRGHLEWTAWILSAYQVLRPRFDSDEETIEFIGEASTRGFNTRMLRLGVWILLRSCRDNLDRVKLLLGAGLRQYGGTFDWTIPQQEGELHMEITQCFYVDFFRAHELPLLTTVLCRLDKLWFDHIDASKHGFWFDYARYKTMSRGAERCVFPIVAVTVGASD